MSLRHAFFALTAIASTAALTACSDDALPGPNADSACTGGAGDTVAITSAGNVVSFNRVPSATLGNNCTIKGLASGETLAAIDQRPANRTIYGLSSAGNLYVLNPANGQLGTKVALTVNTTTPINTACSPAVTQFTALSGTEQKLAQLSYGLRGVVPDGLLVRVSSLSLEAGPAHALQARFITQLSQALGPAVQPRIVGQPRA